MPTLGKIRRLRVVDQGQKPEDATAWVEYRDCTVDEWTAFQGEMAEVLKGEKPGEGLTKLCYVYGCKIVTDCGGFEIPENGLSQLDATRTGAPSAPLDTEYCREIGVAVPGTLHRARDCSRCRTICALPSGVAP